jgi:hypothetical protein
MGALSEPEIFSCLTENCRMAAEHAEFLASSPRVGPTYRLLRDELELIEGACRQAAHWREDTRWLKIGLAMEHAHKNAGEWLRGIKNGPGPRIPLAPGHKHPLFMKLAETLRALHKMTDDLRDKATGRVGMILPEVQKAPMRTQGRPMQVLMPPSVQVSRGGILLPPGAAAQ